MFLPLQQNAGQNNYMEISPSKYGKVQMFGNNGNK
jgi:hypothetical protein